MKIYVHFDTSHKNYTFKIVVEPKELISEVIGKFLSKYTQDNIDQPFLTANSLNLTLDKKTPLDINKEIDGDIKNGDDVYVILNEEKYNETKKCTRNGCRAEYSDKTNLPASCHYHPAGPIFHEGMKGWSCCEKRVVNFDEFMEIPGCTFGFHSDVKPKKAEESKKSEEDSKDKFEVTTDGNVETYAPTKKEVLLSRRPTKLDDNQIKPGQKIYARDYIIEEPDDPLDADIKIGTQCRRNTCKGIFTGDESRTEKCVYHPGLAVFHEASKYWSCCKPRCAEFHEFLKIKGCKVGRHKFLPKAGENTDENFQKCRYDYYQHGDIVVANVYAKKVDKSKTVVKIREHNVYVYIVFENGKYYEKTFELFETVVPDSSKYEILTTKIEIKLFKKDPVSWLDLEKEQDE